MFLLVLYSCLLGENKFYIPEMSLHVGLGITIIVDMWDPIRIRIFHKSLFNQRILYVISRIRILHCWIISMINWQCYLTINLLGHSKAKESFD